MPNHPHIEGWKVFTDKLLKRYKPQRLDPSLKPCPAVMAYTSYGQWLNVPVDSQGDKPYPSIISIHLSYEGRDPSVLAFLYCDPHVMEHSKEAEVPLHLCDGDERTWSPLASCERRHFQELRNDKGSALIER